MTETVVDLKGLKCPLPVLRARKALAALPAGAILVVICTDPMAAIDIPHFVREAGAALDGQSSDDTTLTFRIRKP